MSPVRRHSGVLITALFGAAVPHVIRGAEVAPSDAGPLEEVVVTAERRTERSLDVAASVSVIGGAEIEKLHATSLVDLAAAAPGLVITSGGSPGQTSIVLRGLPAMGSGSLVATVEESLPCCRSCYHIDTLGFALVLAAGAVEGLPSHVNQGETIRWRVRYYSMPATGYGLHYRPATPRCARRLMQLLPHPRLLILCGLRENALRSRYQAIRLSEPPIRAACERLVSGNLRSRAV